MKCPVCGGAELIHDIRDLAYTYKGKTITIPAVVGDFCPACGEAILELGEASVDSSAQLSQ
ncbi:MAG: hypothetical protein B7X31_08165 [Thiomonas sp. 13-66-29]|jgi:HTH-type transcriptional regulator/antitoxin MqsA|nr:MAG: hypothetical protein B7X31_08165 [Thiomonas sp. 13-66-29]